MRTISVLITLRFLPEGVRGTLWPLVVSGFLIFYPIHEDVVIGQTQLLLLFLSLASLHLLGNGRQIGAGILLGIAGAIKLFPLILVVFFIARGKRAAAVAAAVTGVVGLGIAFGLAGRHSVGEYLNVLPLWTSGPLATFPLKQAFGNFLARLFVPSCFNIPAVDSLVLLKCVSVVGTAILVLVTLKYAKCQASATQPDAIRCVALPLSLTVILIG